MNEPLAPDVAPFLPEGLAAYLERARAFAAFIEETNRQFNLTAIKGGDAVLADLVLDSLSFLPALSRQARNHAAALGNDADDATIALKILDLGSGAGIPGLPIALVRPDWSITCLEATRKKADFIERAAAELGLANVRVVWARAEELAHTPDHRERYDAVVMRFVAAMPIACELGLPFLRPMGWLWAVKFAGKEADAEARQAAASAHAVGGDEVEVRAAPDLAGLGATGGARVLLASQKIAPTPPQYPRAPGVPNANPLKPANASKGARAHTKKAKPTA